MGEVVVRDMEFEAEARRIGPEEWIVYWPMISKELDTIPQWWAPYWTKEYINTNVLNGGWQAWGFGDIDKVNIIILTQVMMYPANRILQIMLAFGNSLDLCMPLMEATLERFAVETGSKFCEFIGRPGWESKFPRFKPVGIVFRCEVPTMGVH
jgi:hypothetical protein